LKTIKGILFCVGLSSVLLFGIWLLSAFIFTFGDSPTTGDIANIPKIIFLFSPLVLFYKDKEVQELRIKLENLFFEEVI